MSFQFERRSDMKRIKNFLYFLMSLVIILFSVQLVNATEIPDENVIFYMSDEVYNDITSNEELNAALMQQDELLQDYVEITKELSEEQLAGAYFDDNGELHIMVTEDVPVQLENNNICYEIAQYSQAQLKKFQEIINNSSDEIGFTASGIDQEDNKVVIYSVNDLDVDLLNELIPEDSIKIVMEDHTEFTNDEAVTVEPGTKISNTSTGTYGSVACGVVWDYSTKNPQYGFLTAGHLGDVGDSVSYEGYEMGTITKKKEGGSVDAALILNGQNSNTFDYSNTVCDGKVFNYNGGIYPENTVVYAYGTESPTAMKGKIIDTYYSSTANYIKFNNLILTDIQSTGGNSGGPVLTLYGGNYALTGIIKGHVSSTGNMVYGDITHVKTEFDLNVLRK